MKKVVWPDANQPRALNQGLGAQSTYASLGDMMKKAQMLQDEQAKAQEYLMKAAPAMLKLLEIRFTNGEPLTVMRPLAYQTSSLSKSDDHMDEIDRSFYNTAKKGENEDPGKFVDRVVTINPGTQIMLKSLDMPMREFIFQDALGKEHAISFDDRNKLMTQTDIFETVRKLFEMKETTNE